MTLSCPLPFLSLTVLNREDIGDVGLKVGCEKAAYWHDSTHPGHWGEVRADAGLKWRKGICA